MEALHNLYMASDLAPNEGSCEEQVVLYILHGWGAMYEHLRVVPPGKRLRVPSCTRPEILGSG
jgi:hypothetical protein